MEADDVIGDVGLGLGMIGILPLRDALHLEVQEKAFCYCVIATIAPAAHAANETVPRKHLQVQHAGILTAVVRMDDQ